MTLIWYPKCSTCQRAKKWLDAAGLEVELRDIKEQRPSGGEIAAWAKKGGLPLKRFFNTSGQLYRDMGLKDKLPQLEEGELLELLGSDGMLVKRPILITDRTVLVGFRQADWEQALG